ncbi:Dopey, N-terminal-domain-containing protein [Suillus clintonianus]|uniref:Dopey, N-terminal-domain-containing protein n=1 Tax=Suillus clintonianus TaxID=1904413 RepID=UPI001B882544|nr:Dopey, N-terminal-domain-containing protein [Suillus clintonianus]KAG2155714.1 Dopey, N-terminal-domain-containing protein [Suillus clintonianus]
MSSKSPAVAQTSTGGTPGTNAAAVLDHSKSSIREKLHQTYASDPKYKKYTQQVEKCLNAFDNVHEWADCIAFLKQLLKTFQSYMQFKEIPYKLIVAKRLAQCLNPALPTGVHQRALDVYTHILSVLGTEGLKRDLPLWSSGLFPFFEYAATSVKPILLAIYDTHYLPLQADLRPVMKSFILALLPGLEEETGEFFEKVLSLLDRLSGTVSPVFFIQNIWLIMITMSSARGTALNFLSRRLPRLHADEDITQIVGRDIGLMIRAFAAALEDDNLLVRRGALDILLQSVRIDSAAIKRAHSEDTVILMRAATGVVLRRDLSLNRRLYTWLLGPDEKSENQTVFLRQHALQLLNTTLKDEMFAPSGEYSESRPFKIFISLLDKWEIGSALTDVLVLDALKAIRFLMQRDAEERNEDISMTASTLYEAVEPSILWKQLLAAMMKDLTEDNKTGAIDLTLFLLRSLPMQDDEVRSIHLPVIFAAITDKLQREINNDPSKASPSIRECLALQEEIFQHIPLESLSQRPGLNAALQTSASSLSSLAFAHAFYGLEFTESRPSSVLNPLAAVLEHMFCISQALARLLSTQQGGSIELRAAFSQVLRVLSSVVRAAERSCDTTLSLSWKPSEWLYSMLDCLDLEAVSFTLVDQVVSLILSLDGAQKLSPKLSMDKRPVVSRMVKKLFRYLHADLATCHVRAVNLIWSIESVSRPHEVESIIAQSMCSPESRNVFEAHEAFGVLWRLSEDDSLPGVRLKVPLMIVLETLKHDDPSLRRVGETWMRCNLRSYIRVLEPVLRDLLDPSIRRIPRASRVSGKEIRGYVYERPFDQRYVAHLLDILLSIVQFGGQGFSKSARGTFIRRSQDHVLLQRLSLAGIDAETSYLDALIEVLSRFLQSEPKDQDALVMQPLNTAIQSSAIDLLQTIVARGEIEMLAVEILEPAVIGKLFLCVHLHRLDLQNKLLRFLHSIISASTSHAYNGNPPSEDRSAEGSQDGKRGYTVNSLLTQTIIDGIAIPQNRPVMQHWLDFVLMAVPQFQPALQSVISPIADCLCRQLRLQLSDVLKANQPMANEKYPRVATDAEFIMLLNALERLLVLGLTHKSDANSQEDDTPVQEKPGPESGGILGYVSNVFTTDNASLTVEDQLTATIQSLSPGYKSLHDGIRVLLAIWVNMVWHDTTGLRPEADSLSMIYNRTHARCRRVLEHLFRAHPTEVLESVIECWDHDALLRSKGSDQPATGVFGLVDVLIANAQSAVHMICDSISVRISNTSERSRRPANANLSDVVLFNFLEQYFQRLEGPLALQVWGRFMQLAKDLASSRDFKVQVFLALKCLCVLGDKVTQTTAMDDKRIKKDLQETFGKLLEACVSFVGRSTDSPNWIRRTTKESMVTNGRSSPALRGGVSDLKLDEKPDSSTVTLSDNVKPTWGAELPTQITTFIASTAVPDLRRFLMDNDKVANACSNIVYYIVSPNIKIKARPLDADVVVVDIFREMIKIPPAIKVWRSAVIDVLYDNRIFNSNSSVATKWKPVIKAVFDADKTSFPDLLSRVATSPSANIFTNREHEMLLRSLNLRRLALVLFTGEKNHFLTQLPAIQEKLVDILRNVPSPIVQCEVYLCIRVLLCRLAAHSMTSFWPVILTELYRIFEQIIDSIPSDGSEDLQLILSASKCLDLLLTLQTEEFQMYFLPPLRWIFITDTVDAVFRSDDWSPEAMFDQLAEVVGSLPIPEPRDPSIGLPLPTSTSLTFPAHSNRALRKPMLKSIRQIDSIRDLFPFFSHVSISSYESVYASSGNIDWEAVEQGVLDDMFDSR